MKKLVRTLLIAIFLFVGIWNVDALSDMSSANYQFVSNGVVDSRTTIEFDLAITGATFESTSSYAVYFSHNQNESVTASTSGFVPASVESNAALKVYGGINEEVIEILETKGDVYVWVKQDSTLIASAVKVTRPSLPLNRRFITTLHYDGTEMRSKFSGLDDYSGRKVTYKIGRVTDLNLVANLNSSDSTVRTAAWNSLYTLAKNDGNPYKTGELPFGGSSSITRYMLELVDGAYYYGYYEFKDSSGTYHEFDGVHIYQALNCSMGEPEFNDPDVPQFDWPDGNPTCEIKDGKYYDNNGTEVTKEVYERACTTPVCKVYTDVTPNIYYGSNGTVVTEAEYTAQCTTPGPTPTCEIKDGKYYDNNGAEVTKEVYERACTRPVCKIYTDVTPNVYYGENGEEVTAEEYQAQCAKPICKIDGDKYYGKDGVEVSETEYVSQCSTPICKIDGDKYYGKDGEEVTAEKYQEECTNPTPKCEIKDGKYYDKDGNLVEKDAYDASCGTTPNPKTGISTGFGIALIVIIFGLGIATLIKKKNLFPQA